MLRKMCRSPRIEQVELHYNGGNPCMFHETETKLLWFKLDFGRCVPKDIFWLATMLTFSESFKSGMAKLVLKHRLFGHPFFISLVPWNYVACSGCILVTYALPINTCIIFLQVFAELNTVKRDRMGGKKNINEKKDPPALKSIDCCVAGFPAKVQTISDQKQ